MVGVFFIFRPEGDVEVAIMLQPLTHCCPCVDFADRGAITTGGRSLDNDVDLLFQPAPLDKVTNPWRVDSKRRSVGHKHIDANVLIE
ncbi:hypothetical protein BHE74_00043246 [Ensete ventricosum]|nr:hypothetical protein BHE74_00043246 [Ensete ventricosum]